jgi:spore germination protein GerM
MSAGIYNTFIEQGSDYQIILTCTADDGITPINFNSSVIVSQIRKNDTAETLVGQFTTTGNSSGIITLTLTGAESQSYVAGIHKYDVLVVGADGSRLRIIEGNCTIDPNITVA